MRRAQKLTDFHIASFVDSHTRIGGAQIDADGAVIDLVSHDDDDWQKKRIEKLGECGREDWWR
jgi:hypothetical protein